MPTEQNYLQNWLNNIPNNQILILGYNEKSEDKNNEKIKLFEKSIKDSFSIYERSIYIDKITKINKKSLEENKNKSILAYTTSNINFAWFDNFRSMNYEFVFVQINRIEDICNIHNIPLQPIYYLSKSDPYIILNEISIVEYFINIFIDPKSDFIFKFNQNSIKEYLYRGKYSIDIDRIKEDIKYYKSTFLLTSRLAIFIYKICKFEPLASEKYIGIYYANIFKKSKTFNNKEFSISNTKGYPTKQQNYQDRYSLREEIAKKLASRNISAEDILFATNIDINKIINQPIR